MHGALSLVRRPRQLADVTVQAVVVVREAVANVKQIAWWAGAAGLSRSA